MRYVGEHTDDTKGKVDLSRKLRIPRDMVVDEVHSAKIIEIREAGVLVEYGAHQKGYVANKRLDWVRNNNCL